MARFMRLEVINTLLEIGIVPVFYNGEFEIAVKIVDACARGGAKIIEFTNRGDMAYSVFEGLVKHFAKSDPSVILGIGTIIDAPTAAFFMAAGANFIVGPSLNPDLSRLCNRRKILYIPGCGTESEISMAEELGAEICKVFPADALGLEFIKSAMVPCPWHRLMPTRGVDVSQTSIREWITAGVAAIGFGNNLITPQMIKNKDYDGIASKAKECIDWVKAARKEKQKENK